MDMPDFTSQLAAAQGLPDIGIDDPRIKALIEGVFARYEAASKQEKIEGATKEIDKMLVDLPRSMVPTKLLGYLLPYGVHTSELSDEVIIPHIEQAVDLVMIRHFDAEKRVFPVKLDRQFRLTPDQQNLISRLPEARRTEANSFKNAARLADACDRATQLIVSIPLDAETTFAINNLLMEEAIYAASRSARGFNEMGDAEILRFVETVRNDKGAKIGRIINAYVASFMGTD